MFQTPVWITLLLGTGIYMLLAIIVHLIPRKEVGTRSFNHLIGLLIVVKLAGTVIAGGAPTPADLMLLIAVVLAWCYAFNLFEDPSPDDRPATPHVDPIKSERFHGHHSHKLMIRSFRASHLRSNGDLSQQE